jgi:transcription initiation factor TFIIIB Brf1 subunit/transcription initiation factor TFIIB
VTQALSNQEDTPYFDCCSSPNVVSHQGFYVCQNCATSHEPELVLNIQLETEDGRRHFILQSPTSTRVQAASQTSFSVSETPPRKKGLYYRLSRLNNQTQVGKSSLIKAKRILYQIGGDLEIPKSILSQSFKLFRKIRDKDMLKGRSIQTTMIATIYLMCNQNDLDRSVNEFAKISNVPIKQIRDYYKRIMNEFNISLKRPSVEYHLHKFADALKLSSHFRTMVLDFFKFLKTHPKAPNLANVKGILAAFIYYLNQELQPYQKITQHQLAKISGVTEVTIRRYVKVARMIGEDWRR